MDVITALLLLFDMGRYPGLRELLLKIKRVFLHSDKEI